MKRALEEVIKMNDKTEKRIRAWLSQLVVVVLGVLCMTGCQSSTDTEASPDPQLIQQTPKAKKENQGVVVYKHDGSIQCEESGVPLSKHKKQLEDLGITINCSGEGHDGMMRPTVCGGATGKLHWFNIPEHQLDLAMENGFKEGLPTLELGAKKGLCFRK